MFPTSLGGVKGKYQVDVIMKIVIVNYTGTGKLIKSIKKITKNIKTDRCCKIVI